MSAIENAKDSSLAGSSNLKEEDKSSICGVTKKKAAGPGTSLSKRGVKIEDSFSGDPNTLEEVSDDLRGIVLSRARSAAISAAKADCAPNQMVGNLKRLEHTCCHICHKSREVVYQFVCGKSKHIYCQSHCQVRNLSTSIESFYVRGAASRS